MAWLQQMSSGHYYICFRFGGRKFKRSLKTKSERTALSKKIRLEDSVALVDSGRIDLPPGVDVPTFLLSEGKKTGKTVLRDSRLNDLFEAFLAAVPEGNLEASSLKTMKTHRKHLERILGQTRYIASLAMSDLQTYVHKRSKEKGRRGRTVSPTTIRKELATLRSIWNWAVAADILEPRAFPSRGLRYPKLPETPPFQTFDEVEAQTKDLDPDSPRAKDLWSSVFLDRTEVEELLDLVQAQKQFPAFVYPMFVMAAHTGARRSEIMRSQLGDASAGVLTVRERKRRRGTLTTRRVPLTPRLQDALHAWHRVRPSLGDHLFCHVAGSRSLSQEGDPLTKDEMNHYFLWPLRNSRFKHLLGWHLLRHSFCSNCAAVGVDQRLIDAWVGHTTDEMRRRYRHLFPSCEQQAIQSVFSQTAQEAG